jgi:DNA polymerase
LLFAAVALPPLRPASFFCAVVPPCLGLLPDPLFLPPFVDAFGELAIFAARDFDIPFFFRASYCFSFFTLARLLGMTCDLPGLLTGENRVAVPLVKPAAAHRAIASDAAACKACPLWKHATQTVFGEGPVPADVMLVGEQPGDQEDRAGRPFVGPAGGVLDRAIDASGLQREQIYVTNAVKHFKWTPRGKRRIHATPSAEEVKACKRWLVAELDLVKPTVLVCLGATAGKALLGRSFRVTRDRGRFLESDLAPRVVATIHPSAILRLHDADRAAGFDGLVDDLRFAATALGRR